MPAKRAWGLGLGIVVGVLGGPLGTLAAPLVAQEQDTTRIERLESQLEAVTRELEELRLGRDLVVEADTGVFGFGPAASKVYKVQQGVSIGGYGEVLYENFSGEREDGTASGQTDVFDALRAVVYLGYKFSDKFLFNSETEFEHGTTDRGGSVSVEFAYVDYRVRPEVGLRAGLLLPPMGFINELHEPPTFLGTERPETERQIIPSTWRETGVGVFGGVGDVNYRAYLITGLRADGFAAGGLRDGRQQGSESIAENLGVVGRLDYGAALGVTVGASAYIGNSGQGAELPSQPGQTLSARTFIGEAHGEYKARGFDVRALVALATVDDAALVNEVRGASGSASVGERLVGGYVQAGYDVLRGRSTEQQLVPYVRYEQLSTQDEVPDGFVRDPATDRRIVSLGLSWKPLPNIAVKGDYQIHRNDADTGVDQVNVNIGYLF